MRHEQNNRNYRRQSRRGEKFEDYRNASGRYEFNDNEFRQDRFGAQGFSHHAPRNQNSADYSSDFQNHDHHYDRGSHGMDPSTQGQRDYDRREGNSSRYDYEPSHGYGSNEARGYRSDSDWHPHHDDRYFSGERDYRSYRTEENPGMRGMSQSVKNYFGVGPRGYSRSDDRIRDDVCEALMRDPAVDASQIEVEVKNGKVTLKGEVQSKWMKRRAEECADPLSGVSDVRNEIEVRREFEARDGNFELNGGMSGHSMVTPNSLNSRSHEEKLK